MKFGVSDPRGYRIMSLDFGSNSSSRRGMAKILFPKKGHQKLHTGVGTPQEQSCIMLCVVFVTVLKSE